MRYRSYIIIVSLLFFSSRLFAQDITGLWKGTLHNDTTGKNLRYEIAISEKKGKLSGYSHTFFIIDDKEYYGVKKVSVKRMDGKIIVQDVELIANNYPIPPAKNVHQLDVLTLEMRDSMMLLSGPFTTGFSFLTGVVTATSGAVTSGVVITGVTTVAISGSMNDRFFARPSSSRCGIRAD